ncbi:zinc dependent phospholipase C family protein [Halanaerobium hydrogeniformans]|uniref:Phospholipase C/D domain-containing protein n=1 Tax=Halanaerobium hydrogeniformans TaxID=656519 RepID=E4RJQ5_HALHG|nr:zinc dependent phospholipase C family protein [Halanaerobium hydrogeniformans]ADQ15475.1 hypothetical protein Halsa_2058 [Halanaerobium hydrogeniformans]
MPDFWTHILAGEKIKKNCENKVLKKLIEENYQLFNLGCQGADILFYKDFWPWKFSKKASKLGSLIHRLSGKDIFEIILKNLKEIQLYDNGEISSNLKKRALLVYFLAFISHYTLDSISHPFILDNGGAGDKHKFIEMKIDLYMIKKYWDKDAAEIDPTTYYQLKSDFKLEIEGFYRAVFTELLYQPYKQGIIEDAYTDLRKYHSLFYDPNKYKYHFLKILNCIYPAELASYSYQLAKDKEFWLEEKYQQFERYFNQALSKSKVYFALVFSYLKEEISLKEALTNFDERDFLGQKK